MSPDPLAPVTALPGVTEAVDAARAAVDALLKERALRTRRSQVRSAALARSASASARIDGDPHSEAAALRAFAELRPLARTWADAPLQALARVHALVAPDTGPADLRGRPRTDPTVTARLATLAEIVTTTRAPGIVTAAVVHGELLALSPFDGRSPLVARLAQRLVLVSRAVDPDALVVVEEGQEQLGRSLVDSAAEGFVSGDPEALAHWVTVVAASVRAGAVIARALCQEAVGQTED